MRGFRERLRFGRGWERTRSTWSGSGISVGRRTSVSRSSVGAWDTLWWLETGYFRSPAPITCLQTRSLVPASCPTPSAGHIWYDVPPAGLRSTTIRTAGLSAAESWIWAADLGVSATVIHDSAKRGRTYSHESAERGRAVPHDSADLSAWVPARPPPGRGRRVVGWGGAGNWGVWLRGKGSGGT